MTSLSTHPLDLWGSWNKETKIPYSKQSERTEEETPGESDAKKPTACVPTSFRVYKHGKTANLCGRLLQKKNSKRGECCGEMLQKNTAKRASAVAGCSKDRHSNTGKWSDGMLQGMDTHADKFFLYVLLGLYYQLSKA